MAREFAISSVAEARAYLAHPVLGPRLRECASVVAATEGRPAERIFGPVDAMKLRSSMTLFDAAEPAEAGQNVFRAVLAKYFDGEPDQATLARLLPVRRGGGTSALPLPAMARAVGRPALIQAGIFSPNEPLLRPLPAVAPGASPSRTVAPVGLGVGLLLTAVAATNAVSTWNSRHAWWYTGASSVPPGPAAGTAPLWWHPGSDLYAGQDINRFDVAATGASSPVPPGIPRDPAPGQYYASPALVALLRSTR